MSQDLGSAFLHFFRTSCFTCRGHFAAQLPRLIAFFKIGQVGWDVADLNAQPSKHLKGFVSKSSAKSLLDSVSAMPTLLCSMTDASSPLSSAHEPLEPPSGEEHKALASTACGSNQIRTSCLLLVCAGEKQKNNKTDKQKNNKKDGSRSVTQNTTTGCTLHQNCARPGAHAAKVYKVASSSS